MPILGWKSNSAPITIEDEEKFPDQERLEGRSGIEDEEGEYEEGRGDGAPLATVSEGKGENPWKGQSVKISIVGKPNVGKTSYLSLCLTPSGKSSFLNRLSGSMRSLVSDVAGTTADPIDHHILWKKGTSQIPITLVGKIKNPKPS